MNHPEGMKTECFSTNLLTGSWISPYESSRILEIFLLVVYGTSSFLALICYEGLLTLSVVENHSGLYNKMLSFMAYVFMVMGIDAMSSFLSAAILLCMSNIAWPTTILRTAIVFLCVFLSAHFITMAAMLYIRGSIICATLSLFVLVLCLLFGGGLLRSLSTVPVEELNYLFYLNPLRYANFILTLEVSSQLPIRNCLRTERNGLDPAPAQLFCRWTNGSAYLDETYPSSLQLHDYWTNQMALTALVLVLLLLALVAHTFPQPRQIVDKFRLTY